jgi:SAM-dependent methyltransferase
MSAEIYEFWNKYYSKTPKSIDNNSDFSNFIYNSCVRESNKANVYLNILDLGCGNCRDAKFFANNGNIVTGVDKCGFLSAPHKNINFISDDVETVLDTILIQPIDIDLVYMRWFLHAMPYDKGELVFNKSLKILKPEGIFCAEIRSLNDIELINQSKYNADDKSYSTDHKRWLYNTEMIQKLAFSNNLEILEMVEGSNFSATTISNPVLIRLIAKKIK